MAADINQIMVGLKRDAAGYMAVKCVKGTFFVAAGPDRGSSLQDSEGRYASLEVGFPSDMYNDEKFQDIYAPVRVRTSFKNLTALYVEVGLINEMISQYGGLA